MKRKTFALGILFVAVFAVLVVGYAERPEKDKLGPYKLLTTIDVGDLTGFDISWVDSQTGKYYLANRGTEFTPPKPNITVIDTKHDKFLYKIPLSTRPNGVVAIHRAGDDDEEEGPGTLVVGGGDSTAIFIDLAHPFAPPVAVPTGGTMRADELAYDPKDQLILIANDQDTPPFVTFIATNPPHVVPGGRISYPQAPMGIEQPVWDAFTRKLYIAIPATVLNPNGEVDE